MASNLRNLGFCPMLGSSMNQHCHPEPMWATAQDSIWLHLVSSDVRLAKKGSALITCQTQLLLHVSMDPEPKLSAAIILKPKPLNEPSFHLSSNCLSHLVLRYWAPISLYNSYITVPQSPLYAPVLKPPPQAECHLCSSQAPRTRTLQPRARDHCLCERRTFEDQWKHEVILATASFGTLSFI